MELRQYLASAPLLAKPNPNESLYLYLAVSKDKVSSTLIKEEGGKQFPVTTPSRP